jgi:hypothetical protein
VTSRATSYTGRALGWLFWRVPKGTAKYTVAGFMATAQELGRRWTVWAVFGLYLWGLRWVAEHVIRTKMTLAVSALLLLLWIWRGLSLLKWTIDLRVERARQRAAQRKMIATIEQIPEQMRQSLMAAYHAGVDMRDYGPAYAQTRQMEADQAEQVRGWVNDANGEPMPAGEWRPVTPMPKWLARRLRKGRDQ